MTGIALQALQHEDPTPVLRYFTVWSAVLVSVYGSGVLRRVPTPDGFMCTAGTAGAVMSGLVYLLAIAPQSGFGGAIMTVAANVVLHVALPVVTVALYPYQSHHLEGGRGAAIATLFPAIYATTTLLASVVADVDPVYSFLNSTKVGPIGVTAALLSGGLLYLGVLWVLGRLVKIRRTR